MHACTWERKQRPDINVRVAETAMHHHSRRYPNWDIEDHHLLSSTGHNSNIDVGEDLLQESQVKGRAAMQTFGDRP